jgi:hypothetical protein
MTSTSTSTRFREMLSDGDIARHCGLQKELAR